MTNDLLCHSLYATKKSHEVDNNITKRKSFDVVIILILKKLSTCQSFYNIKFV